MSLVALVIIAFLVTVLLAKSRKAGPAVLAGVVTVCLLLAAAPALGPAVARGTAAFAQQLSAATNRAANVEED